MKHHIAVKFIAVALAALSLFFVLASGAGILVLTAGDLYENSVDQLYEDNMSSVRQNFAVNLVHRYASLTLGNLPEDYLNQYFGTHWQYDTFEYGSYFYTIRDENGNVVESTLDKTYANAVRYKVQVTEVNYRNAISVYPVSQEGVQYTDENTTHPFDMDSVPSETPSTSIPATDVMETAVPTESPTTEPGTPVTEAPDEAAATTPATAQTTGVSRELSSYQEYDSYYDHSTNQQMRLCYTIQELPPYTVELYLLPGAVPAEQVWSLLRIVWYYRYELFWVLGISILAFAVFSVYLCCAAGKKPGREEIRAGGFNCIPLDLYLGLGGGAIALLLVFGYEAAEYLLRSSPKVLVPIAAIAGYGICLIFVGFCFACAAQFKTPGLYWWHHSVTGFVCKLIVRICRLALKACAWILHRVPRSVRWCFRTARRVILWFWNLAMTCLRFLWGKFRQAGRWCGQKLARMYSLLPLTWQWLLVGAVMFLLIGMVFASNGEELLAILCIALFFGIILYGAHAFGILLEGARRMGKGDLATKVSDQFLLGSFKDFARDLNALADVAVVAAQKQMKSERMKTELITNVSHDIKTPLTSIINYVDLLNKAETEEERETYLEVLSRQSQQLKKLIEDLMEMSKASTGNMNVDIISVNAAEAINQALGEFADKLDRAQLIPVFRQPDTPIYMQADGRLAWRVMSNLLSNAVKYALPGTRVYIDLMELEGKVIISMKNISREELNVSADELLERFVRGDTARNTEGSGLGLNIAQSLMEIQKGQLQLLVDGDLFKVTLVFPSATI